MTPSPSSIIENLVADFQARRWQSEPMTLALQISREHPESIRELVLAVLDRLPEGGTYLDAALSFMPESDWPQVVERAICGFETAKSQGKKLPEAAESVLSYASLQFPRFLHPFLERLFEIDDRFRFYTGAYPWRESGTTHFDALKAEVLSHGESKDSPTSRRQNAHSGRGLRAWLAMLETRNVSIMEWAIDNAGLLSLSDERIEEHLYQVGYEFKEGKLLALYPQKVRHLCFEDDYIPLSQEFQSSHPTRHLVGEGTPQRFGGVCSEMACHLCGQALHHWLTLDPVSTGLGVSHFESLTLSACLSCLGWEESPLFYQHHESGLPRSLGSTTDSANQSSPHPSQFPSEPLLETMVKLSETPKRWCWQDWGLSNGRENLNRLGGAPCWIQSAEYPTCPCCQTTMHFLLQLDSGLPLQSEVKDSFERVIEWGSGGIAYAFWCDSCQISAFLWQCT